MTLANGTDGETRYQYDHLGDLISVSYPNGDTVGYEYDEYSRKTGVIYPDGGKASYTYDSMDRLVRVEGADGETVKYAYDALGRRTETRQENLTTTYAYDAIGNLTAQNTTGDSALSLAYGYDPGGRMTREIRTENGGSVTSDYAYDKLGQLSGYTRSDGYAESYRYDAAGNMVQKTADGQKISMRYNKGNQLTEMRGGSEKISYEYDVNGNLVTKRMGGLADTYTYDALDRLTGYSGYDGFEQQYALNAQGLRTSMAQQGSTHRRTLEEMLLGIELPENTEPDAEGWIKTEYIWDVTLPYGQLLTETTGDSVTSYLYGLERISATNTESKTQYVYDGRSSVAQTLTTMAGSTTTTAKSYAYTPFGSPLDEQSRETGFGYNAEYYDAATGMLNLRARQYEPKMNRFSQKDVLKGSAWLPQSMNRYAFVMNDPVGFVDPSGLAPEGYSQYYDPRTPGGGKVYEVNKIAAEMAKSANRASGAVREELVYAWFRYCKANYTHLRGTVRAQYEKAKRKFNNGASISDRTAALIEACTAIEQGDDWSKTQETWLSESMVAQMDAISISGSALDRLVESNKYTRAEIQEYIRWKFKNDPAYRDEMLVWLDDYLEYTVNDTAAFEKLMLVVDGVGKAIEFVSGVSMIIEGLKMTFVGGGTGAAILIAGFGTLAVGASIVIGSVALGLTMVAGGLILTVDSFNQGGEGPHRMTTGEATEQAKKLGYEKTNKLSHGQPVYQKSKGRPKYITPDVDSHSGGVWKGADSVEGLRSKSTRSGTYDANLNRIGD